MELMRLLSKGVLNNETFTPGFISKYKDTLDKKYGRNGFDFYDQSKILEAIAQANMTYVELLKYSCKLTEYDFNTPWIKMIYLKDDGTDETALENFYKKYTKKFKKLMKEDKVEKKLELLKEIQNLGANMLGTINEEFIESIKEIIQVAGKLAGAVDPEEENSKPQEYKMIDQDKSGELKRKYLMLNVINKLHLKEQEEEASDYVYYDLDKVMDNLNQSLNMAYRITHIKNFLNENGNE